MSRMAVLAKGVCRWCLGGGLLLLAIVTLFLAGYFFGWKSGIGKEGGAAEHPSPAATAPSEDLGALLAPDQAGAAGAEAERLASRLSRLANWLLPSRHQRSSSTRVMAEIGGMTAEEAQRGLGQLERAPNTSLVAELRGLLLLRWTNS